MFINPFEYEMFKYLDVPVRPVEDTSRPSALARVGWHAWFKRPDRQASIAFVRVSKRAVAKP